MKDLGEASYVLGIQILKDRKNRSISLSQAAYIDKIMVNYGYLHVRHGITLSKDQSPKTPKEEECIKMVPYASTIGSLIYTMLCTRPDIYYVVRMISRY